MRKCAVILLLILWIPHFAVPASAVPVHLNAAEEAALTRFCAASADDLLAQLSLAAVMLNRCADPRFPDQLTSVLASGGYAHAPVKDAAWQTASCAVRLAAMGINPTAGALFWRQGKDGIEFW